MWSAFECGRGLAPTFDRVHSSSILRSGVARRPGPLEVEATQVAGHIQHFTDKVQTRAFQRFHGLGRHFPRVHAAQCHFGGAIAFGAGRYQLPARQFLRDIGHFGVGVLLHWLGLEPVLGQQVGHLLGEDFAQQGFQLAVGPLGLLLLQPGVGDVIESDSRLKKMSISKRRLMSYRH